MYIIDIMYICPFWAETVPFAPTEGNITAQSDPTQYLLLLDGSSVVMF